MLDEWLTKQLDRLLDGGAALTWPWRIRLRRGIGFRAALITDGLWAIARKKKKEDEPGERFDNAERFGGSIERLFEDDKTAPKEKGALRRAVREKMARADEALEDEPFVYLLFLTMLSVCLLVASGAGELAALAAFFCLSWLASAMDSDYEPVCGPVRQRYLAALLLRGAAYLVIALDYFVTYSDTGIQTNIVLQSMMLVSIAVHLVFYLVNVAFNRRQSLFARVICGVLGVAPALAAAAGASLGAATIARELPLAVGGVCRATGILMAFLSQQLLMITQLGGVRLMYRRLWPGMLMTIGYFLMLAGAWLSAL